jgi:hypothetical protein
MTDYSNILLISDEHETTDLILKKLVLLRKTDKVSTCQTSEVKKVLKDAVFNVVLLHETDDTIKIINTIKNTKPDVEILLLLNGENKDLTLQAYDNGIFDYLYTSSEPYEFLIKTVNCFKARATKDKEFRNEKFLYQLGVIDGKTNMYQCKYLKDIFIDLSNNPRIQNGTFAIVTLDEKAKTKVSINRLALIIKNTLRMEDIACCARGGKFYLVLSNTNLESTNSIIQKFQEKMGSEFQIRAGLAKIKSNSFETLEKNALDGLTSSIQNDEMAVCLESNFKNQDSWLEEDSVVNTQKEFRFFNIVFNNKLNQIIAPVFYRFQKDFETKLTNTEVSQYSNNIECVFSLKNEDIHSELIIRYDNFAKCKIEIIHSGLESPENTKIEVPLTKITDKFLSSLLKQLKNEYKQSVFKKGN